MMDEFQEKWPEPRWLAPNRVASMPDAHGIAGVLDQLVAHIGRAAAWLTLMVVTFAAAESCGFAN